MLHPLLPEGNPSSYIRKTPFKVDGWLVKPALCMMTSATEMRQVEPKVMAVLACLAACPGEPVPRETFMNVVWADVVVTDDALTRCIVELRKIFGDNARQPQVIETIPRVGYRLIVPVEPVAAEPAAAGSVPALTMNRVGQDRSSFWSRLFRVKADWPWATGGFLVLAVLLAVGLWTASPAISSRNLTGTITDASTGRRLPGVMVLLVGKPGQSVADLEGRYHLIVPDDTEDIRVSFVGYVPQSIRLKEEQSRLDVALQPREGFTHSPP